MTTKTRIPRDEALAVAHEAIALLAPACTRLEIAGSLRRGRPDVADVELVAVPSVRSVPVDLFGEVTGDLDELDGWCRRLVDEGVFVPARSGMGRRGAWGPRYKRFRLGLHVARGLGPGAAAWAPDVPIDLFSVREPAAFGVIFLLRTGPAAFSKRLVTPRQYGGFLPIGFHVRDGALWNAGERLQTPEEADVFAALRAPFLAPEQRTDTVRLSLVARGGDGRGRVAGEPGRPAEWAWYDGDAKTGWWAVEPAQPEEKGAPRCP